MQTHTTTHSSGVRVPTDFAHTQLSVAIAAAWSGLPIGAPLQGAARLLQRAAGGQPSASSPRLVPVSPMRTRHTTHVVSVAIDVSMFGVEIEESLDPILGWTTQTVTYEMRASIGLRAVFSTSSAQCSRSQAFQRSKVPPFKGSPHVF